MQAVLLSSRRLQCLLQGRRYMQERRYAFTISIVLLSCGILACYTGTCTATGTCSCPAAHMDSTSNACQVHREMSRVFTPVLLFVCSQAGWFPAPPTTNYCTLSELAGIVINAMYNYFSRCDRLRPREQLYAGYVQQRCLYMQWRQVRRLIMRSLRFW